MIQRAIIAGLTSTGVHVADLRISPAAVTRHVLKTQAMQAGVHVGRSSTDPEVIQVRVFEWPGNQMTAGLQKEVEKHFGRQELRRATFAEVGETTYPARVRESYAQDILDVLDVASIRERRFRVAIDYGHSPAAFTLPLVLGPLGVEAIGARGTYADDVASELEPIDASRIVTGVRADLGVVLDRAAERLVLVDERGASVPTDVALLLVVRLLVLAGRSGRIAVPVTTTSLVDELVDGLGALGRPDAALRGRADAGRGRGGRRARRRADRRLRVPGRRARLRRRDGRSASCSSCSRCRSGRSPSSSPSCRARARPPRAPVPVEPQGARDAPPERAARREAPRPHGRRQGVRRAWLGAGASPIRTSRSCTSTPKARRRRADGRARRGDRRARRGHRAGRRRPKSELWSKPQAEVDPSASRLLQSTSPTETVPNVTTDPLPDLTSLSDDDLERLLRDAERRRRESRLVAASSTAQIDALRGERVARLRTPGGSRERSTWRARRRPRSSARSSRAPATFPTSHPSIPTSTPAIALGRRAARDDRRARARGGRPVAPPADAPRADRHPARRARAAAPRAPRRPRGARPDPRRLASMSHVYCPECGFQNPRSRTTAPAAAPTSGGTSTARRRSASARTSSGRRACTRSRCAAPRSSCGPGAAWRGRASRRRGCGR